MDSAGQARLPERVPPDASKVELVTESKPHRMLTPDEIDLILWQDHYRRRAEYLQRRLDALETALYRRLGRKPAWDSIAGRYTFGRR